MVLFRKVCSHLVALELQQLMPQATPRSLLAVQVGLYCLRAALLMHPCFAWLIQLMLHFSGMPSVCTCLDPVSSFRARLRAKYSRPCKCCKAATAAGRQPASTEPIRSDPTISAQGRSAPESLHDPARAGDVQKHSRPWCQQTTVDLMFATTPQQASAGYAAPTTRSMSIAVAKEVNSKSLSR